MSLQEAAQAAQEAAQAALSRELVLLAAQSAAQERLIYLQRGKVKFLLYILEICEEFFPFLN